jgi:metal-responsive CopG/Arc/MetJ family transcriptional regulator
MAVSLRIAEELLSALDQEVQASALSRSEVVRLALENYLAQQRKARLKKAYIAQARNLIGDDSWQALEDEFASNDAACLQVAEAHSRYPAK